jgi:hypothetical protein
MGMFRKALWWWLVELCGISPDTTVVDTCYLIRRLIGGVAVSCGVLVFGLGTICGVALVALGWVPWVGYSVVGVPTPELVELFGWVSVMVWSVIILFVVLKKGWDWKDRRDHRTRSKFSSLVNDVWYSIKNKACIHVDLTWLRKD